MTETKIIADSITPSGARLTTMQVPFHRFVLSEFNTHRRFSRNSASSRAIPVRKQIERIMANPAMPVIFPREQRGMQGGEELDPDALADAKFYYGKAVNNAINSARALVDLGVHKSVVNRLLEPFMWHTVVVTSTEWDNFFVQRCSSLAQPEIRVAAEAMRVALDKSEPQMLVAGEWHLPYVVGDDETCQQIHDSGQPWTQTAVKVSTARVARTSYLTQEGKRDIEEDLRLYDRLVTAQPPHWSPLEQVATPWAVNQTSDTMVYNHKVFSTPVRPKIGNLTGWLSLRTASELGISLFDD